MQERSGLSEKDARECAPIPTDDHARSLNSNKTVLNRAFHKAAVEANDKAFADEGDADTTIFHCDGDMVGNNWQENPK